MNKRLYFVAAEASGDLLAAEVIEKVRARCPEWNVSGVGGAEMARLGIVSPIDLSGISILGLFEGFVVYREVLRLADRVTQDILRSEPDAVILVDSWGFMIRVAERLKRARPGIHIIKLIGPQVWATRPGRARKLAAVTDHLLCMHDIEVDYYKPYDLPTTVIGNPALARGGQGNPETLRKSLNLPHDRQILLVLPGSRPSEIRRVAPALMKAAERIKEQRPEVQVLVQPATTVLELFETSFPEAGQWSMTVKDPALRYDAMAAADVALACSGTVTSEIAVQGTVMIVAYKTGWMTWALARGLLYSKKNISLLNILNGDTEIVPEFVQTRLDPSAMAALALGWLSDDTARQAQADRQARAAQALVKGGAEAAAIAASAIVDEVLSVRRSTQSSA
jgi:lipid-A-disaccharide synthase